MCLCVFSYSVCRNTLWGRLRAGELLDSRSKRGHQARNMFVCLKVVFIEKEEEEEEGRRAGEEENIGKDYHNTLNMISHTSSVTATE